MVGAIASDLAVGYLPLPESMKSGVGGMIAKVFVGLAIGAAADYMGYGRQGRYIALGAVTVPLASEAKKTLAETMPHLPLEGMGYFNPALIADQGMGMFTGGATVLPHPAVAGVRR